MVNFFEFVIDTVKRVKRFCFVLIDYLHRRIIFFDNKNYQNIISDYCFVLTN